MEMSREEFGGHDHHGREKGPQEKSLERHGHRRSVELWDQPEHQSECDREEDVSLLDWLARIPSSSEIAVHPPRGNGSITYGHGYFFSYAGCHKPQDHPSYRDAQPEPRGCHPTGKGGPVAHPGHKGYDPSAKRDLDAHISQQKEGTQPGDASRRSMVEQRLSQSTFAVLVLRLCRCLAELGARGLPKRSRASRNFNRCTCNLN